MGDHRPAVAEKAARVDDRRVISGILWRFRAGVPWRGAPERSGPRTTLYNPFVHWRQGLGQAAGAPMQRHRDDR